MLFDGVTRTHDLRLHSAAVNRRREQTVRGFAFARRVLTFFSIASLPVSESSSPEGAGGTLICNHHSSLLPATPSRADTITVCLSILPSVIMLLCRESALKGQGRSAPCSWRRGWRRCGPGSPPQRHPQRFRRKCPRQRRAAGAGADGGKERNGPGRWREPMGRRAACAREHEQLPTRSESCGTDTHLRRRPRASKLGSVEAALRVLVGHEKMPRCGVIAVVLWRWRVGGE